MSGVNKMLLNVTVSIQPNYTVISVFVWCVSYLHDRFYLEDLCK